MNSTIPKRHAETLRNQNVPFQSKNQNDDQNGIDNFALHNSMEKNITKITCLNTKKEEACRLCN